jgi:signal transduction histidine kinase
MSPILRKLRPWLEPAVGIVFFTLWTVAEIGRYQQFGLAGAVALLGLAAAIALSRALPMAALALVAAVLLLQILQILPPPLPTSWPIYLGIPAVVFVVAYYAPKRISRAALVLGLPLAAAFAAVTRLSDSWWGVDRLERYRDPFVAVLVVSILLYAGAWALGFVGRSSLSELRAQLQLRSTAAQLGQAEVELQLVHERDRIAREVHDVLAHSLAVVIAQADGARFIRDTKPAQTEQRTDDALVAISDAARAALIDVRTLVEGLREDQGEQPQPGLEEIPVLLAQLSRAGMTIDARHFGDAKAMTPAQQLAVYRIVQESLTNALRHGDRAAATRLSFDWRGPGLALSVTSVGAATEASAPHGNGIRGMKDRARLAGGWLTAGASDIDGEFVVTLFVPTGTETSATEAAA